MHVSRVGLPITVTGRPFVVRGRTTGRHDSDGITGLCRERVRAFDICQVRQIEFTEQPVTIACDGWKSWIVGRCPDQEEGSLMMIGRISFVLLSGAIGLCLTGCAASTPTMRAQSPSFDGAYCESGYCQPGVAGQCQTCPQHCDANCLNVPFHPVHRNFHTYDVPKNLSYPDQLAPAVYQYPYYTTRGPTDFFMK